MGLTQVIGKVDGLRLDEALLTGESLPAEKAATPVSADAALGDRASMAHAGAMVLAGQGTGLVTATGRDTEIGRISTLVDTVRDTTTPLLRRINRFGRRMTAPAR